MNEASVWSQFSQQLTQKLVIEVRFGFRHGMLNNGKSDDRASLYSVFNVFFAFFKLILSDSTELIFYTERDNTGGRLLS